MNKVVVNTNVEYHPDIKFLLKRMDNLLVEEEYERMVVIKRWLNELIEYYHGNQTFNK